MSHYRTRPMRPDDLDRVMEIEEQSFPTPWPASAYRYEIEHNTAATYVVLENSEPAGQASIFGYAGFWRIVDEAHISTIAVDPRHRGRGLGKLLLLLVIRQAELEGADCVTLEVRRSNLVAQALYRRCGFRRTGIRVGYYSDTREDAFILTSPSLRDSTYRALLEELEAELVAG